MADKRFNEAKREQVSFLAPLEKKCLIWLARPHAGLDQSGPSYGARSCRHAGSRFEATGTRRTSRAGLLLAIACLVAQLVRGQPGWHPGPVPQQAAAQVRLLCGSALSTPWVRSSCWPGWASSGYMSERIAAGLLIVYFMLSIEVYLAAYTLGSFHLSFWKFSPTELRLLLIIGNLALMRWPMGRLFGHSYPLFDIGGLVGFLGMSLMLIVAIARAHGRAVPRRACLMSGAPQAGIRALALRWLKFHAVGIIGVVVQLGFLAFFKRHFANALSGGHGPRGRGRGIAQLLVGTNAGPGSSGHARRRASGSSWSGSCVSTSPAAPFPSSRILS